MPPISDGWFLTNYLVSLRILLNLFGICKLPKIVINLIYRIDLNIIKIEVCGNNKDYIHYPVVYRTERNIGRMDKGIHNGKS